MPATLDALARSLVNVHPMIVQRLATFAYYDDFSPISDAEVVAMLERAPRSPVPGR
jgi:predicted phosphoribosyltransferase